MKSKNNLWVQSEILCLRYSKCVRHHETQNIFRCLKKILYVPYPLYASKQYTYQSDFFFLIKKNNKPRRRLILQEISCAIKIIKKRNWTDFLLCAAEITALDSGCWIETQQTPQAASGKYVQEPEEGEGLTQERADRKEPVARRIN